MARKSRPLTPDSVRARVLSHVQRYAAPRAHVQRLFRRKIARSAAEFALDRAALEAALEAALDTAQRYGYIDDAHFAEVRAARAISRGVSPRQVQARLGGKGLSAEVIAAGLAASTDGSPERAACEAYVKKRRLGRWRPPEDRADNRTKDLARLGRAGFSYGVARAALEPEEERGDEDGEHTPEDV